MSARKPHASEKTCKWRVMIHRDMLNLIECTSSVAFGSAGREELMSKKESYLPPRQRSQLILCLIFK